MARAELLRELDNFCTLRELPICLAKLRRLQKICEEGRERYEELYGIKFERRTNIRGTKAHGISIRLPQILLAISKRTQRTQNELGN
jgi:hypothetical protein